MRRLLGWWIVLALAVGAVVAVRGDAGPEPVRYLPSVLPIGATLHEARLAVAGGTLRRPLSYRRAAFRRGGTVAFTAQYVNAPAPEMRQYATWRRQPLGDGIARVASDERGTGLWWSTSRRSGTISSVTMSTSELLAMARGFDRLGFVTPAGYRRVDAFDPESATEVLRYRVPPGSSQEIFMEVHRHRHRLLRIPADVVQRQVGDDVVTAQGVGVDHNELQALVRSMHVVTAEEWRQALTTVELDPRTASWATLARGRSAANAGWSLAVERRGDQRCVALLVMGGSADPHGACHVANWRADPMLAVPADRSGPATVTVAGRRLRTVADVRYRGQRILVAELPAGMWGQVIDPVEVVGTP